MLVRTLHTRAGLFCVLLAGFALLAGCGEESPTQATGQAEGRVDRPGGPFTLVLGAQGQAPAKGPPAAAKRIKPDKPDKPGKGKGRRAKFSKTARGQFAPHSANAIGVRFEEYVHSRQVQVLGAYFEVAEGSINREALIAMTVFSGTRLEDIWVQFSPSHVTAFDPEATLTLVLKGNLTEEQVRRLVVHHFEGGAVTEVQVRHSADGELWKLVLKIPGFSRYSLDDGDGYPEADTYSR